MNGDGTLSAELQAGEVAMVSMRKVQANPQIVSTNRHIMQGMCDLRDCKWDDNEKVLKGESDVIAGEAYVVVIAKNGFTPSETVVSAGDAEILETDETLVKLMITSAESRKIHWKVKFRN